MSWTRLQQTRTIGSVDWIVDSWLRKLLFHSSLKLVPAPKTSENGEQPPIKASTTVNHRLYKRQPQTTVNHIFYKTFLIHRKTICFGSASGFTNRQILILLGEQVSETLSPRSLRKSIFFFLIFLSRNLFNSCVLS